MPAHTLEWTADMARALPDDGTRYEVLDGAMFVTTVPWCWLQRVARAARWLPFLDGPRSGVDRGPD